MDERLRIRVVENAVQETIFGKRGLWTSSSLAKAILTALDACTPNTKGDSDMGKSIRLVAGEDLRAGDVVEFSPADGLVRKAGGKRERLLELAGCVEIYEDTLGVRRQPAGLMEGLDWAFPDSKDEVHEVLLNNSLDAAGWVHVKAGLHKGWTRSVDATAPEAGIEVVLHPLKSGPLECVKGDCRYEAHAWLAAILRAKAEELT